MTIAERLSEKHDVVLATRLSPEAGAALQERFPDVEYHPVARLAALVRDRAKLADPCGNGGIAKDSRAPDARCDLLE